jgi:hypothetical protein
VSQGRVARLKAAAETRLADGGAGLPAGPILAAICAAAAALIVVLGMRLTFFNDEWYVLLQRPGLTADSVFAPHNEHVAVIPVLVYKALIALFGFESQLPFRLVHVAVVISLGVLVFLFVRERLGPLLALLAAAIILFLGPAWEDLLWSFQIGIIGSLLTGAGALIAIEHRGPRSDAAGCALLVCSVLLSDLGIPFVIAATASVLLRRGLRRLWIVAVPTLVFAAWWIGYGHEAETNVTLGNILRIPSYVMDGAATGLASLAGLSQAPGGEPESLSYGRPLLVLAAVGVAVALRGGWRPSPLALVIAIAAISFWALAAANYIPDRNPTSSRYQLVNATLIIMLAAEAFRAVRVPPGALVAITALALVAWGANVGVMWTGYDFLRYHARFSKAAVGTLEIMRGRPVPPNFQLVEDVAQDPYVSGLTAERFYEESDAHGLPPHYSQTQLYAAPPEVRQAADNIFLAGYQVHLGPVHEGSARKQQRSRCPTISPPLGAGAATVTLPSGGATVTNLGGTPVEVGMRRLAPPDLPTNLGLLAGGFSARVAVPRDSIDRPWLIEASGGSALAVCP